MKLYNENPSYENESYALRSFSSSDNMGGNFRVNNNQIRKSGGQVTSARYFD